MTKEKLLQLVSEAYDEGAKIDINFFTGETEAGELADQFSEYFTESESGEGETSGWHRQHSEKVTLVTYWRKDGLYERVI
jgi:hypothetical protein